MNDQMEAGDWREKLGVLIESVPVQRTIIALIITNAIILGLETSQALMQEWGNLLRAIDALILMAFVVEIVLRIVVHRLSFFRDPWSLFDFIVVAIALVPASGPLAVLRALRVLRVLRLLTMVPSMRRVIGGMMAAIPGLGSVMAIMLVIFYVSAVIATNLFSEQFPEWFGSLAASSYTLFQVMTLESWSMGIVRPVMEIHPNAWLFFIIFILIATFTMLNLFIAVIVNAVQMEQHSEFEETQQVVTTRVDEDAETLRSEIVSLRSELRDIKALLKQQQ
ncbi:ion transporter [Pseudomonadota bacterium]